MHDNERLHLSHYINSEVLQRIGRPKTIHLNFAVYVPLWWAVGIGVIALGLGLCLGWTLGANLFEWIGIE